MAEEVGFEPTIRYKRMLVFKTSAISQTLPFFRYLVRVERFELPTLCSQSRCATRLRYTRLFLLVGVNGYDPLTPVLSGQCSTTELYASKLSVQLGLVCKPCTPLSWQLPTPSEQPYRWPTSVYFGALDGTRTHDDYPIKSRVRSPLR